MYYISSKWVHQYLSFVNKLFMTQKQATHKSMQNTDENNMDKLR